MPPRKYDAREIIFTEGEPANAAFAVLSGKVELVRQSQHGDVQMAVVQAGMCVGETAIFSPGAPYSVTAKALEPSIVESLSLSEYELAVRGMPPAAAALVNTLASRFQRQILKQDESAGVAEGVPFQKITIAPADIALSKQIKPVTVSPSQLPFRIGGFPTGVDGQINRQNHMNIPSEGPPLIVSRSHCEIALEEQTIILSDLGSRFNTVVNGKIIGRGRGTYQLPLNKGKNDLVLGGLKSPYRFTVACE